MPLLPRVRLVLVMVRVVVMTMMMVIVFLVLTGVAQTVADAGTALAEAAVPATPGVVSPHGRLRRVRALAVMTAVVVVRRVLEGAAPRLVLAHAPAAAPPAVVVVVLFVLRRQHDPARGVAAPF